MLKIIKNPKDKPVEVMWDSLVTVFQPGERKSVEAVRAHHFVNEVNAGLLDVTDEVSSATKEEIVRPGASSEVVEANEDRKQADRPDYLSKTRVQLFRIAKEKGLKTKFKMTRQDLLDLVINERKT